MYHNRAVKDIKEDFIKTLPYCKAVSLEFCKERPLAVRAAQSVLRLFAPML